jgi:hypothetical protein
MCGSVCQGILDVYFLLNRRAWRTKENKRFLQAAEDAFGSMIKPYLPYFEGAPREMLIDLYNKTRTASFADETEKERLSAWLNRVTQPAATGGH